ncbi:MFS transporter, DHA1 family, bicyclomycin/chloramphenicol resistance protein [Marinospirillum celere]|uniref:Bcr/CflA family efflux transporter n=1 Tax=Marinospirillum celere TaxID=1122252 RepID=A0A1I1FPC8_9GAMM|nr:multidrug effflux MFS transporter [Marinospirillum celere]SFC01131.1 MFS transporter, DHA1 family, bicyclomycin/chloramphenicol resistance protein [Marinospirillum celere]
MSSPLQESSAAASALRLPGWAQGMVLVGLVAMSAVSTDLYLAGLPAMVEDLGATHSQVQLTLSLFMLGFALGQLINGPLSDSWGRIPVLKLGLVIFFLASLLCIWAPTIEVLWLGRILQGIGASVGPVLGRAIVSDVYPRQDAARILAYLSSAMALVPALAPILGSLLLIWFSWRSHFVALSLFACLVLLGVSLLLWETRPQLAEGEKRKLSDLLRLMPRFLLHGQFMAYVACASTAFGAMFAYISSSSYLVMEVLGLDAGLFGYTFAFVVLGFILGAFLSARLVARLGLETTLGWGMAVLFLAAGLAAIFWWLDWVYVWTLMPAMLLVFAAGGLTLANSQAGAVTLFRETAGSASAVFGLFQISTAGLTGALAGYFYKQTLLPLAVILLSCAFLGAAAWWFQLAGKTKVVLDE